MSLLERLSAIHLQMLKDAEIQYPFSAKKLQNELAEVNHWYDLKYITIINLTIYLGTGDYTPTGIDKLFSNDSN
jgi:hypothetical protein